MKINQIVKNLLSKLNAQENISLKKFSTLRVGGLAKYLVYPKNISDLKLLQKALLEHNINYFILGGGSNTLFSDEVFDGVVIKLSPNFSEITKIENNIFKVGASAAFAKLTKICANLGWQSSIGWVGTPGVAGGALKMNAGSRLGVIADVVKSVTGVLNGEIIEFDKSQINYSYRKSYFPKDFIITSAILECPKQNISNSQNFLSAYNESLVKRKKTQPVINSLGSFFKNPYPHFAGELIENCNLKGQRHGGAEISLLHANFIINRENAKARDIIEIAKLVRVKVYNNHGVWLEPEVLLAGDFPYEAF